MNLSSIIFIFHWTWSESMLHKREWTASWIQSVDQRVLQWSSVRRRFWSHRMGKEKKKQDEGKRTAGRTETRREIIRMEGESESKMLWLERPGSGFKPVNMQMSKKKKKMPRLWQPPSQFPWRRCLSCLLLFSTLLDKWTKITQTDNNMQITANRRGQRRDLGTLLLGFFALGTIIICFCGSNLAPPHCC